MTVGRGEDVTLSSLEYTFASSYFLYACTQLRKKWEEGGGG